jgi:hypothetical protein
MTTTPKCAKTHKANHKERINQQGKEHEYTH